MDVTWRSTAEARQRRQVHRGRRTRPGDRVLVRDTKDRQGPVLAFDPQTLTPVCLPGEGSTRSG
jgi:Domain of unknown function (DUF397)